MHDRKAPNRPTRFSTSIRSRRSTGTSRHAEAPRLLASATMVRSANPRRTTTGPSLQRSSSRRCQPGSSTGTSQRVVTRSLIDVAGRSATSEEIARGCHLESCRHTAFSQNHPELVIAANHLDRRGIGPGPAQGLGCVAHQKLEQYNEAAFQQQSPRAEPGRPLAGTARARRIARKKTETQDDVRQ